MEHDSTIQNSHHHEILEPAAATAAALATSLTPSITQQCISIAALTPTHGGKSAGIPTKPTSVKWNGMIGPGGQYNNKASTGPLHTISYGQTQFGRERVDVLILGDLNVSDERLARGAKLIDPISGPTANVDKTGKASDNLRRPHSRTNTAKLYRLGRPIFQQNPSIQFQVNNPVQACRFSKDAHVRKWIM